METETEDARWGRRPTLASSWDAACGALDRSLRVLGDGVGARDSDWDELLAPPPPGCAWPAGTGCCSGTAGSGRVARGLGGREGTGLGPAAGGGARTGLRGEPGAGGGAGRVTWTRGAPTPASCPRVGPEGPGQNRARRCPGGQTRVRHEA